MSNISGLIFLVTIVQGWTVYMYVFYKLKDDNSHVNEYHTGIRQSACMCANKYIPVYMVDLRKIFTAPWLVLLYVLIFIVEMYSGFLKLRLYTSDFKRVGCYLPTSISA